MPYTSLAKLSKEIIKFADLHWVHHTEAESGSSSGALPQWTESIGSIAHTLYEESHLHTWRQ